MMLKKGQLILVQKKNPLFTSCNGMFIFISRRTKKWVFVISDSNYEKINVGCVADLSNLRQI